MSDGQWCCGSRELTSNSALIRYSFPTIELIDPSTSTSSGKVSSPRAGASPAYIHIVGGQYSLYAQVSRLRFYVLL